VYTTAVRSLHSGGTCTLQLLVATVEARAPVYDGGSVGSPDLQLSGYILIIIVILNVSRVAIGLLHHTAAAAAAADAVWERLCGVSC